MNLWSGIGKSWVTFSNKLRMSHTVCVIVKDRRKSFPVRPGQAKFSSLPISGYGLSSRLKWTGLIMSDASFCPLFIDHVGSRKYKKINLCLFYNINRGYFASEKFYHVFWFKSTKNYTVKFFSAFLPQFLLGFWFGVKKYLKGFHIAFHNHTVHRIPK